MAKNVHELRAQQSGYLAFVDTKEVGMAVVELGGGRKKKEDNIDHGVGIKFLVKVVAKSMLVISWRLCISIMKIP